MNSSCQNVSLVEGDLMLDWPVRSNWLRTFLFGVFLISLVCLYHGCGSKLGHPDIGKVKGKVLQNQQPLPEAWIEFHPESQDARTSIAITDANGEFELLYAGATMGARLGTHLVKIGTGGQTDPSNPDQSFPRIQLLEKSGVEVKPGNNVVEFEVPVSSKD